MDDDAFGVDRHDVESNATRGRDELEIVGRGGAETLAFARVDGSERRSESAAPSGFDLDEDERRTVERDDVDLAARTAKIPREHAIAERVEMFGRARLARAAEGAGVAQRSANSGIRASLTRRKPRRWCSHGPCSSSAAMCCGVA